MHRENGRTLSSFFFFGITEGMSKGYETDALLQLSRENDTKEKNLPLKKIVRCSSPTDFFPVGLESLYTTEPKNRRALVIWIFREL